MRDRYEEHHPDWLLTVSEVDDGPWIKAAAVMPALAASSAEIVIVADADIWCDGLADAVAAVTGGYPWALPHRMVRRLNEKATAKVLDGRDPAQVRDGELVQRPYIGIAGGGALVARRQLLLEVPLDARFVGWGREDESWGMALETLAGGPRRGSEPLHHLWHPPQDRPTRSKGSPANEALRMKYVKAHGNPDEMRRLLAGATAR